ncbi:MAG: DUF4159 domain-containing protein [Planctomycetota bacterium]
MPQTKVLKFNCGRRHDRRCTPFAQRARAWPRFDWVLRRGPMRFLGLILVLLLPSPTSAQNLTPAAVDRAIAKGVAYLKANQDARGSWDRNFNGWPGGETALCTLALLNAGVPASDPSIQKALAFLRSRELATTYAVSLETLVYCEVGAAGDLPRIRRNVKYLVGGQLNSGAWYYGDTGGNRDDPSNAQFAILALGAAEDRGIQVPQETFQRAYQFWIRAQQPAGGWRYHPATDQQGRGSMTCAGIASVVITRERLSNGAARIVGDTIQCCGDDDGKDAVDRGFDWLANNFSISTNPGATDATTYYYLYALERAGRLSGRRFVGRHDWYREGADFLLSNQDDFRDFWNGGSQFEPAHVATSFALLFLAKGKRRVAIGQLRYADNAKTWQRHPGSLPGLIRHTEAAWKQSLTWQTVAADRAKVADFLQTPVLVISGRERLKFSDSLIETLGEYLDQGGTILFDADGGNGCGDAKAFQDSAVELVSKWVPDGSLEKLPVDHPIWSAETKVDVDSLGADEWVYGVQSCCRTSIFYFPQSLSCRWSLGDVLFRRTEISDKAKASIRNAVAIGMNLLAYATGRELKEKLASPLVIPGADPPPPDRGSVRLATLALGAGENLAPRAIPNAVRLLTDRVPVPMASVDQSVALNAQTLADVGLLYVHGRTEFEFTEDQVAILGEFVKRGGVIVASAICGSESFTRSFREQVRRVTDDRPLELLPADHPVMEMPNGYSLQSLTLRRPGQGGAGTSRRTHAVIEAALDERGLVQVFFSPLDLSCALESPNSVQCPGYSTDDAAKIVANLVLFSLLQ